MRMVTRAYLLDKYGLRLTMEQLAAELGIALQSIHNQLQSGTFPIATYRDGTRRWADYEAVADYFDDLSDRAKREMGEKKPGGPLRVV